MHFLWQKAVNKLETKDKEPFLWTRGWNLSFKVTEIILKQQIISKTILELIKFIFTTHSDSTIAIALSAAKIRDIHSL